MVRTTLKRGPGDGARPGGGAPLGGGTPPGDRVPGLPPTRPQRERRTGARGHRRPVTLMAWTAGAGLCALAACALATPGFVMGAGQPSVKVAPQEAAVVSPSEPTVAGAQLTTAADEIMAADSVTGLPASGDLLVTLPWGSSPGEVGLLEQGEGLARGPEALAAAPDGRIAVLDSVNGRLLFLDPTGEPAGSASIPLAAPRFLAVDNDWLYVLDCDSDRRLVTFDWRGTHLGTVALPELNDVVTGLFATDQGPCLEVSHETVLLLARAGVYVQGDGASPTRQSEPGRATARIVAGRPLEQSLGRVAQVTFKPGRNARLKCFDLDAASLKAIQTRELSPVLAGGRPLENLVSVDGDGIGGLIIGARLLKPEVSGGREASLVLTRLASEPGEDPISGGVRSGVEEADMPGTGSATAGVDTLFLTDSPFVYLGQPYVVAPDGRILQPWGSEGGYSILVHSFAEAEAR